MYRPLEGGRLVDLGTAVNVQPVPNAAYRDDFRENKLFAQSTIRIWDLSCSRQACYGATTRPL